MLSRQATKLKEKNQMKKSARFIEEQWLLYVERKKMRDVRKYL